MKTIGVLLTFGFVFVYCIIGFSLAGCPKPLPPAPIGPTTDAATDIFRGKLFNCGQAIVSTQRELALPPAENCLLGTDPETCLSGLATLYAPDTVACVVRDRGSQANAKVLAEPTNSPDENEILIANAARSWIISKGLGYK